MQQLKNLIPDGCRKDEYNMKMQIKPKAIALPTPVFIVGTYDENNVPNGMNVAWGGICSSNPPCISVSIRKERYTYKNIVNRKSFTVNIPSIENVKEADYFGLVSGREINKFEKTKLTPKKAEKIDAPYIEEFPFNIECKLIKEIEVGEHMHLIGEIVNIMVDENCLDENQSPDIEKLKPISYNPLSATYHEIGKEIARAFKVGKEIGD